MAGTSAGAGGLGEAELAAMLDGVSGWLHPAEARVLHRHALEAFREGSGVVEIGSWQGRSTISLAAAARAAGAGTVVAIDPHISTDAFDGDTNLAALRANLAARGLDSFAEIVRRRSSDAASSVPDGSVGLLFIDGDHSYEGASSDITSYAPKLRAGAVVGFNDPVLPGVRQALLEHVATPTSGFSKPSWVVNSLFFVHGAGPMSSVDQARLKTYLAAATAHHRLVRRLGRGVSARRAEWLDRWNRSVARWAFTAILPGTR